MLDIIQNNPYRILGIYSNSPTKDRVANHNRLKAFLKVGKDVSFGLDIPALLPAITRTSDVVSNADAKLTLPGEQLRYAQFWFLKATALDDIAMNHLIAGNADMAMSIWEKKDNASSLQNRVVCALINDNYPVAFTCAEKLYSSSYISEFASSVLGQSHAADTDNLVYSFLEELCTAIGAKNILPHLKNTDWKQYVGNKTIKPLIDLLLSAVNTAKASNGKGITARYNAGVKLMDDTKAALAQLKALLPVTDLQYQMIADKIGLEILQCGIDYYNDSEAADAARKAMKLQAYALSVVVGKMAKDRCKENVDILQKIIDNLPPTAVCAEDKAIKEELRKFCLLPDKICHAVTLLNNAKPHLQSIKAKLGVTNAYYLKVSTQVVGNALHNIIEEVNNAQKDETIEFQGRQIPISMLLDRDAKIAQIKKALLDAWNATRIMDTFDMESDFKVNRYNENRSILKNLCDQLDVPTTTVRPKVVTTKPQTTSRQASSQPSTPSRSSVPKTSSSSSADGQTSSSDDSGCVLRIICVAGGFLLGAGIADAGGAIAGGFIGLFIYGIITGLTK